MFYYSKYTYRAFLRSVFMKYVEKKRLELTHEKSDFFVDRVDQDEQEALTFFQMVFYQKSWIHWKKKRTTNKSKKSCLTDFTTFDPVMVLWLVLAHLHLSELTGRIGQSASGTRQFCRNARDATCQSSHRHRARVVWLEADLSPQNRRIPLADSDWPVLTNSKGAQWTAALASMAAISTSQIKNLIRGWNEL